jgi:hypothetical protein
MLGRSKMGAGDGKIPVNGKNRKSSGKSWLKQIDLHGKLSEYLSPL